ncbi:ABC transporter permease [Microbacterium sp. W4I20]|uniref:ABC transporter permease n=1 Tax=Microbacterium sp. W4I20 TaxID=3042262 RepID=UPI00278B5DE7|nr:ABC transporter permease [Microbacterium sp. W4I20]MDQ0728789.1 peptide/nickel transport system permease protein [Microbacterium sp. W4I20]
MLVSTRWAGLLLRRAFDIIVVLLAVVAATTIIIRLAPGDPARSILGNKATPEALEALRSELGLNEPVLTQIGTSLLSTARGDVGNSLISGAPVLELIGQALPVTLGIILLTVLISVALAVPLGLYSALRQGTRVDRTIGTLSLIVLSTPAFVLALLLIAVFAVGLGWLPAGGWSTGWPESLRFVLLPSVALAGYLAPQVMRSTRQSALSILNLQFLEAAEARGLSPSSIVLRHLLPNSALPIISVIGVNTAALLSSAVIVEVLFGLPGFGLLIQEAVASRDYTVLQGTALVAAVGVVLVNFACEILYRIIDPRIRIAS